MKILIVYGTRPEYIKLKPLFKAFNRKGVLYKVVQVRQHTDLLDGCFFEKEIELFGIEGESRFESIYKSLSYETSFGLLDDITHILVQGDTHTATAAALLGFNRDIPVIHVEAGLRSFDRNNPYPEEINRKIISSISTYHFCPTFEESDNLVKESTPKSNIWVTGNTSIDNIRDIVTGRNNEILVTLHRQENLDMIESWFYMIERLALLHPELSFVFPMHPNSKVQKHRDRFKKVKVIDPLPFEEMAQRIANCRAVITDSGGIQEECNWFRKRCYVCRKVTERNCDTNFICPEPVDLGESFFALESSKETVPNTPCVFGDGNAAELIATAIKGL